MGMTNPHAFSDEDHQPPAYGSARAPLPADEGAEGS